MSLKEGKSIKVNLTYITLILIIVSVVLSIIQLKIQNKKESEIVSLKENIIIEQENADKKLSSDKDIWDKISKIDKDIENYTNKNQEEKVNELNFKRVEIMNSLSEEFQEAIEWATDPGAQIEEASKERTPFEKEGYKQTYYKKVKELEQKVKDSESKIRKSSEKREQLNLSIILYISILITSIIKLTKNNNILQIITIVMFIISTIILAISI